MHLYIHIPFCRARCAYCDFNSYPISDFNINAIDSYVDTLTKEMHNVRRHIDKKHVNLKTIYIGGGTPSLLNEVQLKKIIFSIREYFGLTGTLEFSMECNPESVTRESLRHYKGMGINRISLGIQTFYNDLLTIIDRPGTIKDTEKAIEYIKREGFSNFSFDLIFALPHQTSEMFHKDLVKAVSYEPPHISLYCMTLNPQTIERFKKRKLSIPPDEEQIKMYRHGVEFLEKNGYPRYEISNFARKGFESRHNLSYWHHKEYIGLGAGASSYMNDFRTKNETDVKKYMESINTKGNALKERMKISAKEARSEFVFLSLRLSGGLDFEKYLEKFSTSFQKDFSVFLDNWKDKNMFTLNEKNIALTENGILLSDELFRDLF